MTLKYYRFVAFATAALGLYQCEEAQPPPGANVTCGVAGTSTQSPQLTFTASLTDCVLYTDRNASYRRTFSYDAGTSTCGEYHSRNLSAIGFQPNPNSNVRFYDYQCFACRDVCPEPTTSRSQNRLVNPGFEFSSASYPGWTTPDNAGSITHPGANGTSHNAFACTATANRPYCLIEQTFVTCQTALYMYSVSYRAISPPGTQVVELDAGDAQLGIYPVTTNTSWQRVALSFQPQPAFPDTRHSLVEVMFSVPDGHGPRTTFELDDARVVPLPSPLPTRTGAPQLVKNGGFEASPSRVVSWRTYEYCDGIPPHPFGCPQPTHRTKSLVQVVSPGYAGSLHAVRLRTDSPQFQDAGLGQNVTTIKGVAYVISLVWRMYNASRVPVGGELGINIGDLEGLNNTYWSRFKGKRDSSGWYSFQRVWVATSATSGLGIGSSSDIVLDNVSVVEAGLSF